jgi:hypothetical protein
MEGWRKIVKEARKGKHSIQHGSRVVVPCQEQELMPGTGTDARNRKLMPVTWRYSFVQCNRKE